MSLADCITSPIPTPKLYRMIGPTLDPAGKFSFSSKTVTPSFVPEELVPSLLSGEDKVTCFLVRGYLMILQRSSTLADRWFLSQIEDVLAGCPDLLLLPVY